ncbi:site-specific DNA-methyltransferase [Isobaculum melis]|uniref:Adenine-specific DNA-methyltransferase n=1 Tax=Isobaculum melis TaxID=142588 RepID=A0A1H9T168_9LACT|nr:site-specific DNA-methyltransferase [Isobaculum melis]SER90871.1 adenine-specific DNA-methyltransferase [Isobaculum melis]
MGNKLELTWYGKEKKFQIEPRLLIENKELSNIKYDVDTENMLIHGDNLLVLKALESKYAGKVKCIYIDPPYNTGSAFEHYDDNIEHSQWLSLMKARLEMLKNLLSDDGSIFVQIDDEEYAYLKVLMDEVFGRNNYINTISVLMKNIAGASGGGQDKRLKKNIEYILIYSKNYELISQFTPVYSYSPISKLVEQYREENKSWKYTTALINKGDKIYIGSTVDGEGNEIKIYKRENYLIKSVKLLMKDEKKSEKDIYAKYAHCIFQTAMPQSSIRPRVLEKVKEIGFESDLYSIEYVPRSGRNKGKLYEQFYKGESFRLFAWLKDVSVEIDGKLCKKDLQGTYWDFVGETKNLTKEGGVEFPNGKKAEKLLERVFTLASNEGDLVMDSFLGSGTTSSVAHKMNRKWIGVEMGQQAYTHCKVRLDKVISGEDKGGITKSVDWKGGGGYKFYELAPSLINIDTFGEPVINKEYSADMLASAVALHEGFYYQPSSDLFWKQSRGNENSYLFVTTRHLTAQFVDSIKDTMEDNEFLVIACRSFDASVEKTYKQITIKKIPNMLLGHCEFNKDDYKLNIINPPVYDEFKEDEFDEQY